MRSVIKKPFHRAGKGGQLEVLVVYVYGNGRGVIIQPYQQGMLTT